jgi:uncharacterized protein
MYLRSIASSFKKSLQHHVVLGLTGPRGVGKTEFIKSCIHNLYYVDLEDPVLRSRISENINSFLNSLPRDQTIVFDEIHLIPGLLKEIIQFCKQNELSQGSFCVVSSLSSALTPLNTLPVGSYRKWTLWPLSTLEMGEGVSLNLSSFLYQGMFPVLHRDFLFPEDFNRGVLNDYLTIELSKQAKVHDLNLFQKFIECCAVHCSEVINYSKLGELCGISYNTAKYWLQLLVDSHIVLLLSPYMEGFGKRIVKSSKIYFIDTGFLCYLLKIKSLDELNESSRRASVFESFVVSESFKVFYNKGLSESCYFWRDKLGRDIALLIDKGGKLHPIDILSKEYIEDVDFNDISRWKRWAYGRYSQAWVTYMGQVPVIQDHARVVPWSTINEVLSSF